MRMICTYIQCMQNVFAVITYLYNGSGHKFALMYAQYQRLSFLSIFHCLAKWNIRLNLWSAISVHIAAAHRKTLVAMQPRAIGPKREKIRKRDLFLFFSYALHLFARKMNFLRC